MAGPGSLLTLNGATFRVGLQSSVSSLKSVTSGLPAGVLASDDAIAVTEARAVLDGYDFRGYSITVQADDVTIRNSLFDATGYHTIHQEAGSSRMIVEYNTFDGEKANIDTHSDMVLSEEDATIRNNEFVNLPSDAVNTAGGLIERNYFAGASYQTGAHADAISIHRTVAPLIIHENYIDYVDRPDAAQGSNAAVKIVSHFGAIDDVTVDSNVLLGGGYTIYTGPDKHPVSNVRFTNNDIGLGQYGDLMGGNHGQKFSYAGNRRFSTDARLIGDAAAAAVPTTDTRR
jgi:serralysin